MGFPVPKWFSTKKMTILPLKNSFLWFPINFSGFESEICFKIWIWRQVGKRRHDVVLLGTLVCACAVENKLIPQPALVTITCTPKMEEYFLTIECEVFEDVSDEGLCETNLEGTIKVDNKMTADKRSGMCVMRRSLNCSVWRFIFDDDAWTVKNGEDVADNIMSDFGDEFRRVGIQTF